MGVKQLNIPKTCGVMFFLLTACGEEDFRKPEGEQQFPEAFLQQTEQERAAAATDDKRAKSSQATTTQEALKKRAKSDSKTNPEQVPASALQLQRFFTADTLDSRRLRLLADEIISTLPQDPDEFLTRIEEIRRYIILNYDMKDPSTLDRLVVLEDALDDFTADWNHQRQINKRAWQWGGFLVGGTVGALWAFGRSMRTQSVGREYWRSFGKDLLIFPPVLAGAGYVAGNLIASFRNEREEIDLISLDEIASDFYVLDENFSSSFREYMNSDLEDMESLIPKAKLLARFVVRDPDEAGVKWDRIRELYRREYSSGQGEPELQLKARILENQIQVELESHRSLLLSQNDDTRRVYMVVGAAVGAGTFLIAHRYLGETSLRTYLLHSFVGLTTGGALGMLISPVSPDSIQLNPLDRDSILDTPESRREAQRSGLSLSLPGE